MEVRIAFITDGLGLGGKERQLTEIVKYLKNSNYKTFVYYFKDKRGFLYQIKRNAFKTIQIPKSKKKSFIPFLFIYNSLKINKVDIIHTFDSMSTFYSIFAAKFCRIPIINGSIRDAGIEKGLDYWFKYFNLKCADRVVANSMAGLKYYKISNGFVVYNAIDKKRFENSKLNAKNIVMTASFSDYKDHLTFLLVTKRLIEKNKINTVYLIGDGINREKYQKLVLEWNLDNRIIFTGRKDNVEKIIAGCDIGVLCSTQKYREGVSNSILEYMATGLITIGSNIGGTAEIIKDGFNGFLFNVEDQNDLYNKINYVLSNNQIYVSIIKNANNTIKEKFSFDKNIGRLLKIYSKILDEKNKKISQ